MTEETRNRALPAPVSAAVPAVPERYNVYPPFAAPYGYAEPEPEEPTVPLSHYLWILRRNKWKILAFVFVAVVSTVVVSSRLTPIYESTATIDIDRQAPPGVIGQDAARLAPNDSDQFLATQIRLVQSDSVLRPVAERYKLKVVESPPRPGEPLLPTSRAQNAPVKLGNLKVTRPPNTYLLLIAYRSPDADLASDVANAIAHSYILHTFHIRFQAAAELSTFMEKQMEELKAKMEKSSAALAEFEKDLSVINPDEKTSILSSRLLQFNNDYTSAQSDRMLKESAYNSVKGGSFEAAEASSQGEQLRKLADRVDEAREKLATVKAQFGANHPEFKKANSTLTELERQIDSLKANIGQRVNLEYQQAVNRESLLKVQVAETKAEFDRLNARSFEYKSLKQEADTDKGLYEELVRKIKEAGINSSFQNSSIRLADSARPALKPVFPDLRLNAILAFLFSVLLAVGAAVIADVLDNTLTDSEQIQKTLKTVVLGSLPTVKGWRGRLPSVAMNGNGAAMNGNGNGASRKALVKPVGTASHVSAFEEAIRTLRDSILLSDPLRRPRSLLMTSAVPREGKTTTSAHLAVAHSLQKRKTLLIDADLRRPGVHSRFGLPNERGLCEVVKGEAVWPDVIQKVNDLPDLTILTAGTASRHAADRLGTVLEKLLAEAESEYDLIIVDAPPLLGFAEPLQMATVVDGVVVVALAGQTNRNAVANVLSNLSRLKVNVIGLALNEVRQDMSDRYYYYGYYGKYYSKYYKPTKG
jgi:capsular exopolysaccharide synthesis family protein